MNPSDLINEIEEIASNLRLEGSRWQSNYRTTLLSHIKSSRGILEAPHLELTQTTFLLKELIDDSFKYSYRELDGKDFYELKSRFSYMPPLIEWDWFINLSRGPREFAKSIWNLAIEDESESFTQVATGYFYCAALGDWYLTHFRNFDHAGVCKTLLDRILNRLQYWACLSEHIDHTKWRQPYLVWLLRLPHDKYERERKSPDFPRAILLNSKQFFKVSGFADVWDEWSKDQLKENDGSEMSIAHLKNEIHFLEVEKVILDKKGGEIPIPRKLDKWQKERLKLLKAHLEVKMRGERVIKDAVAEVFEPTLIRPSAKPPPKQQEEKEKIHDEMQPSEAALAKQTLYVMAQDSKAFRVFCAASEAGVRFSDDQRKVFGQLESFIGSEPAHHELEERADFHETHKVDEMIKELKVRTADMYLKRAAKGGQGIDTKKSISKSGSVSIDRYVYSDPKASKGKGGENEKSKGNDPKLLERVIRGLNEASKGEPVKLKHISMFVQNSLATNLRSDAWYPKVIRDESVKEAFWKDEDGNYSLIGKSTLPRLHPRLQPVLELYGGESESYYIKDKEGNYITKSYHKVHGTFESYVEAEDVAELLCVILPHIAKYCDEWEQGTVRDQLVPKEDTKKPKKKVEAKKSKKPKKEEDKVAFTITNFNDDGSETKTDQDGIEVKKPIAEEPEPAATDVGKVEEPIAEESDSAASDVGKVEPPEEKLTPEEQLEKEKKEKKERVKRFAEQQRRQG